MQARKVFCSRCWCAILPAVWLMAGFAHQALAQSTPPGEQKAQKTERPTNAFKGRVVDQNHKPLADVIVAAADAEAGHIFWTGQRNVSVSAPDAKLFLFIQKQNGKRVGKAETNDMGRFSIRALAHGTYHLVALDPKKGLTKMENVEFSKDSEPLEVVLEPFEPVEKHGLKGRVVNEAGDPVADASVAVVNAANGHIFSGPDNRLHGFAFSEDAVNLTWFHPSSGVGEEGTATTDADGNFSIANLASGKFHLAALHPDKGRALLDEVEVDGLSKPLEVVLKPVAKKGLFRLKGQVLDHDGEPVSGAIVAMADSDKGAISVMGSDQVFAYRSSPGDAEFPWFDSESRMQQSMQTTSDSEGNFSIRDIQPGSYNIIAVHKTKGVTVMKDVAIEKGSKPIKVELNKPTFVKGRVQGQSAAGLAINERFCSLVPSGMPEKVYFNCPVLLRDGGRFRVGPLPQADRWTLSFSRMVEPQGYAATLLTAPVHVRPGRTARLTVDLTEGATLAGEVRGPKGEALSGVSVLATASDASGWAYGAVSDADGKYTIKGLPDGDYKLEVKRHAKRTAPG